MFGDIRGPRDSPDIPQLPYGTPVPGKPGHAYSPYFLHGAAVDVTLLPSAAA